jgi:hypothetical protein
VELIDVLTNPVSVTDIATADSDTAGAHLSSAPCRNRLFTSKWKQVYSASVNAFEPPPCLERKESYCAHKYKALRTVDRDLKEIEYTRLEGALPIKDDTMR